MKIGYVCADPGIPVFGQQGCSLHVQEMIHAFRQHGADLTLFANRVGGSAPSHLDSLRLVQLPELPPAGHVDREAAALIANVPIAHTVKAHGPFDIIYERYALWSHAALAAGKSMGATTILEVNAPLIEEQESFRTLHNKAGAVTASQRAFAAADLILAVSHEVARYLEGYPQVLHKVVVIPNGVNADRFLEAPLLRRQQPHPFTVGFVGTLKPWHGVDILLRAFALFRTRTPDSRLLIVGDGPEKEHLLNLAQQLAISDNVEFTGSVPPQAVPELLARMDVGAAPYPEMTDFYFSPLKAYEYMAAGLPVVASDIGQLTNIVETGKDGILCPPGRIEELSEALADIQRDPARAQSVGLAGQQKVRKDHTWHSVAGKVLGMASRAGHSTLSQGVAT